MGRFIFKEIYKNIFTMDDSYCLAQCISADYALGKGVAVEFEKRYHLREQLLNSGEREYPDCILINNVFNLVTKLHYNDKPTYQTMRCALLIMKDLVISNSIRKVAIVRLGCGLDKLDWERVREMINDIFQNVECEMVVCNYNPSSKYIQW